MATDTNVETLIINKMTKAQYEALEEKEPTELYVVTDESLENLSTEDWTFTLEDGTDVTKTIVLGA